MILPGLARNRVVVSALSRLPLTRSRSTAEAEKALMADVTRHGGERKRNARGKAVKGSAGYSLAEALHERFDKRYLSASL